MCEFETNLSHSAGAMFFNVRILAFCTSADLMVSLKAAILKMRQIVLKLAQTRDLGMSSRPAIPDLSEALSPASLGSLVYLCHSS